MNIEETRRLVNDYPDFPSKGIVFRDLLPILKSPNVFKDLVKKMSSYDIYDKAESIVCIDARGFIFGTAIAIETGKPLIFARKPGKLPGELIKEEYTLEYGKNSLSIQKESLKDFKSFVIVDDLLATGGTVDCIVKILNSADKKIEGLCVAAELISLNGRKNFRFPVFSEIKY